MVLLPLGPSTRTSHCRRGSTQVCGVDKIGPALEREALLPSCRQGLMPWVVIDEAPRPPQPTLANEFGVANAELVVASVPRNLSVVAPAGTLIVVAAGATLPLVGCRRANSRSSNACCSRSSRRGPNG